MAQINKSSLLAALSGTLGKELVIKQYKNKVVVSRYPDMSRVKPSPLQLKNRERMKAATAYALSILRNPELKDAMEKELKPGESVYHKAKKWYLDNHK
jgi:hypothetical protein